MMCFGVKERKRVKTNHCVIVLLDDTQLVHEVLAASTGQDLLDVVIKHLNLLETSYFGLRYVNSNDQLCWLDVTKSASKQLKDVTPMTVYFSVKFYATDPCKLVEEITRYQFFLQIKQDILQARLPVSFDLSVELFALAVQSELGDYDPQRHLDGYVGEFQFVPNQTIDLEKRAAIYHRNHLNGQVPATAELNFLERVKWLDLYGCHLVPIQYENCDEYALGLGPTGILVLRNKFKVAHYLWPRIIKGKCQGRCFLLDVIDKNNEKNRYGFRLANKEDSRQLREAVCLHKEFFQLTHSPNSLSQTSASQANQQRLSERFRNSIRSAINIGSHHRHHFAGSSGSLSSKKSSKLRSSSGGKSSTTSSKAAAQQKQHLHYMQQQHHHHHQASQRSLGAHHGGSSASIVGINTNFNRQQPTVVRMPSRRYSNRDVNRNNNTSANITSANNTTNHNALNIIQPASAMMAYNMNIGKSQTLKALPTQKIVNGHHYGHQHHHNYLNNNNNNNNNNSQQQTTADMLNLGNVAIVPPGRHIVQPSIYKASSIVNGMHTIGVSGGTGHDDEENMATMQQLARSRQNYHSSSVNPSPRSVRSQRLSQVKRHSQSTHDSLNFVSSAGATALAPSGPTGLPNGNQQPHIPYSGGNNGAKMVGPLYPSSKLLATSNGPTALHNASKLTNNLIKTNSNNNNKQQQTNKQLSMQNEINSSNNMNADGSHQSQPMTAYMPPPPPAYSGPRPQQLQQQRHLFSDNESDISKSNAKLTEIQRSNQGYHHQMKNAALARQHHDDNLPTINSNDNHQAYHQGGRSSQERARNLQHCSSSSSRYLNNNNHNDNDTMMDDNSHHQHRARGHSNNNNGDSNRHHHRHHRRRSTKNRHNSYDDDEAILNSNDDDNPSAEEENHHYQQQLQLQQQSVFNSGKPLKPILNNNTIRNNRHQHHDDSYDSDTYYSDDDQSGCSSTNDLMDSNNNNNSNKYSSRHHARKRSSHKSSHRANSNSVGLKSHLSSNRNLHQRDNQQQSTFANQIQSNHHQPLAISDNNNNNNNNKKGLNLITSPQHQQQQQTVDSQWKAIQERHNKFQQNRARYLIDGNMAINNLDNLDGFNNNNNSSISNNNNNNNSNNDQSYESSDNASNNIQQPVSIRNIANKQATPIVMAMNHFFNQNQQGLNNNQQTKLSPNLTDSTQSNVSSPSLPHHHHHQHHNNHHQNNKSLATASTSTTTSGYYGGSNSIGSGADSDSHTTVDGIGSTGGSSLNSNGGGGTAGLIESSSIKLMKSLAPAAAKNGNMFSSQNRHLNTNHSAVNNWQLELSSDLGKRPIANNNTSSGIMKQTHGGKHELDSSPVSLGNLMTMDNGSNMFNQNNVVASNQANGQLKYVSFDV